MCLCVFFCCGSDLANTKCGDDTFVDESAVAAVMGFFNCSYSKAVDIWRADRIAAHERLNKVLRRQATKTLQYPHVPAKDQDLYAQGGENRTKCANMRTFGPKIAQQYRSVVQSVRT